jgi:hypothetical protein
VHFLSVVKCCRSLGVRAVNHRSWTVTSSAACVTCWDFAYLRFSSAVLPTWIRLRAVDNTTMPGKVHDACRVQSAATESHVCSYEQTRTARASRSWNTPVCHKRICPVLARVERPLCTGRFDRCHLLHLFCLNYRWRRIAKRCQVIRHLNQKPNYIFLVFPSFAMLIAVLFAV